MRGWAVRPRRSWSCNWCRNTGTPWSISAWVGGGTDRVPAIVHDAADRDARYPVLAGYDPGGHSWAALPLVIGDKPVGALAQIDDELRHVALHLLDALAQPVGRRGHVSDVLAGLGLGRVADLLGAALGRLDDGLDLVAGLGGQRRRGSRLAAHLVDLVGDPVEMGVDRGRVVAPAVAGEVVPHDRPAIQGHGPLSLARSRPRPA